MSDELKPCKMCRERGKTWEGSDPQCAFVNNFFNDNWNCATVNEIREICYEGQELPSGVDYQYCDDQKYATIKIYNVDGIEGNPLALWVSWYKNRGGTDAMWLLFEHDLPRKPTERECLLIIRAWNRRHDDQDR